MNNNVLRRILCCSILVFSSAAGAGINEMSDGAVSISPHYSDGNYRGVTATGTIRASVEDLWRLLVDYEQDPEYMPTIRESRVLERVGNSVTVQKKVRAAVFNINFSVKMTENTDSYILEWDQVSGPFLKNRGRWTLVRISDTVTLAKYYIELDHPLMPLWLARRLLYKNVPEMFRAIRTEVSARSSVSGFTESNSHVR